MEILRVPDGWLQTFQWDGRIRNLWLDWPGRPKSFHGRIEQRYRLPGPGTIELRLTPHDPEFCTSARVGEPRTFGRHPSDWHTVFGWYRPRGGNTVHLQ